MVIMRSMNNAPYIIILFVCFINDRLYQCGQINPFLAKWLLRYPRFSEKIPLFWLTLRKGLCLDANLLSKRKSVYGKLTHWGDWEYWCW